MASTLPRTRGLCKAGQALGLGLMHLDTVLSQDEFPYHRHALINCIEFLRSLQEVRNEDRRAGYHSGGEPFVFRVIPNDELDDDLPEMPPASYRFPAPCPDVADF